MTEKISSIQAVAESWSAEQVLRWAFAEFGRDVAISSAFGVEGVTLIDIASRIRPDFRLFTIDTEFLFPETYGLMDRIEARYGIRVEKVYSLLSPEEQERQLGAALWSRNPDQCCNLRKVEPLRRKLTELRAWITGIRRDQTSSRAHARKIEWDATFGLVKINPIVDWTSGQIWQYVVEQNVPYNPLHDQDFPSIGCTHCTRAIRSGEDPRAGRWSGFTKTECGLHVINPLSPSKSEAAEP
jgi:phosphoadenosine phosphosulfate reductase